MVCKCGDSIEIGDIFFSPFSLMEQGVYARVCKSMGVYECERACVCICVSVECKFVCVADEAALPAPAGDTAAPDGRASRGRGRAASFSLFQVKFKNENGLQYFRNIGAETRLISLHYMRFEHGTKLRVDN